MALMLGEIEGKRRRRQQRKRRLDHQLGGRGCEQTPGVGDGSLACCSPWGSGESDTT